MIGRESELKSLIDRYDSGRFEMIPVMGRRRVGKTTLLKEFAKGRNGVYFSATRGSLEANIAKLASRVLGTPSPVRMSVDELFDEIRRRSAEERYLLIIDEYPYMVRKDERFSDALQEFIDEIEGDSKLFLILCGSSMSMMKHQVLSSKAPLYGRRTGQLELKPMEIWDVREMLGGFCGAGLVWLYYIDHYKASASNTDGVLGTFCTMPAIEHKAVNFFCEMLATFVLVFLILMIATKENTPVVGLGSIGAFPVTAIIMALGMSLGGTTGYAMNPARDLGPRCIHALIPLKEKRDSGWSYSWVPVLGPLTGGALAAALFLLIF